MNLLEQVFDDLFFVTVGGRVHPAVAVLEFVAFVDQKGDVAAVVDHHFGTLAVAMVQRLVGAFPIFFEGFALPGEHRNTRGGDGGGSVILRREDVAACPAHACAEVDQRLDENRGLDRHVERTGDPDAGEGFILRVFLADRHQAGHFVLGDVDFLAAPIGEAHVGDFVVSRGDRVDGCCAHL